jgi:hypothetical protein
LQLSQLNNPPNAGPQGFDCAVENLVSLAPCARLFGIRKAVWDVPACLTAIIGDGNFQRIAPLAQYHQSRIDRNARQPSREARPSAEIPNVQEGSQEGILQRVLGVFAVSGNPINPGKKCLPKGLAQLFESRCSTLFCGRH